MTLLSFDTETYLIQPGRQAPPLIVASFATDPDSPFLLLREHALEFLEKALADDTVHFVGQHIAFDWAVVAAERPDLLPPIFAAYAKGRIHDIMVRDMLLLNAEGLLQEEAGHLSFTMEDIVRRRFEVDLSADKKGPDAWRTRYAELDGLPLGEWPDEAKRYALDDARWPLRVYEAQEVARKGTPPDLPGPVRWRDRPDPLHDEPGQTRAAWGLYLMQVWGIRTDEVSVRALEERLTAVVEAAREKLIASKILKGKNVKGPDGIIRTDWARDTKLIKAKVEAALGDATPKTDPSDTFPDGQTKIDEETLRASKDPDLLVLADVMGDEKLLTTYVQALKGLLKKGNTKTYEQRGLYLPGEGWLIQSRPNVLVASGRTSWSKPNLQNPPRKGGVRECFVPRPGHWFCSVDYSFIEMVCWAQTCLDILGYSTLADAIRKGEDPHCILARNLLEEDGQQHTYEEVVQGKKSWAKPARTAAKAGNFGLMGGMGPDTFAETARKEGLDIDAPRAAVLRQVWKRTWTEADPYFYYINSLFPFGADRADVVLPRTGFVRGGCTYTSACNTYFQGLAARGAKEAIWKVAEACYTLTESPLYGCRPVVFLHDELILEVPAERLRADAASRELMRLMEESMQQFVPDVPVKSEPTLMARWYKEAEPVYGADGVLELWTPKAS